MIPFSPPRIDQEIIDEVINTLQSGWITTGPKTKLFEKKLSEYNGNPTTICVNSATAGLELVLRWFGIGVNDEIILPAYTYTATANVIMHCGAKPVFVDINSNDFNISVANIKKAITNKTKVIMPVDLAGFPCDYNEINQLVCDSDIRNFFIPKNVIQKQLGRILVLSDAAHSLGAKYYHKNTGSLTDITVFSFHVVKNLTTAEGGAIAFNLPAPFNNEEIYKYFNVLSLHGQSKDALAKTEKGEWRYDVAFPGFKANMTDISASIGLIELKRYENDMLIRRKKIFDMYAESFVNISWAQIPLYETENKTSSYHVFLLRINNINELTRDKIIQSIFDQDVSVNVHFIPVPMLSFYKNIGYNISDFPHAYDNFSREISLPVYYNLKDEQVKTVIDVVIDSVQKNI